MLDIKKFKELPIYQQQELKEALKFVDDMFAGDIEMKNEYLMQYGVFLSRDAVKSNQVIVENVNKNREIVTHAQQDNQIEKIKEKPMIYSDEWIVMQNRLLHAISRLTLDERRIVLFLSSLVRHEVSANPNQTSFVINVRDFIKAYHSSRKDYYEKLKEACKTLKNKNYSFWDFVKDDKVKSEADVSWASKAIYRDNKGEIIIDLHQDTIKMLTIFDKSNPFTKYQRDWIVKLGIYGIILLELILSCMHQKFKQKSYTVKYLREKFDCTDNYKYQTHNDFRRYVINKAIKEIHENTPIRISYQQKKIGRVVTEIVFSFDDTSEKAVKSSSSQPMSLTNSTSTTRRKRGLTDKQILKLSIYTKEFVEYNTHKITDDRKTYQEIFDSWRPLLKNKETVNDFYYIQQFLDLKKGDEIPDLPMPSVPNAKAITKTVKATESEIITTLSSDKINFLLNNQEFIMDYSRHMGFRGEVGSKEHIEFLRFRLTANFSEFMRPPLSKYFK